tara:strand:- start:313 stop:558 length:246 start_codon:yes stop_codon:yes gene_type:complete
MSTHSLKAKRRHPDTTRERITVGHITFELSARDKTFALIAGEAMQAKDRRPMFSGFIEPEMEKELRRVAFRMKTILGDSDG